MEDYLVKLVVTRLQSMPPNASFSIGRHGDFTKDELIKQVKQRTPAGKAAIEMELNFLREMPKLAHKLNA